ncbi:gas vesicle protein [Halorubrum sp. RMP-47]|uniref:Gas vesicle protein n=1 Tax=Halorubrum miltondacostae TaxID=3076378 RepID=A0ABD5MBA8_9EURY
MPSDTDEHADDDSRDPLSDDPAVEVDDAPSSSEPSTDRPTDPSDGPSTVGLLTVQENARDAAKQLLDSDFEGIIEVSMKDDEEWRALVEVVERRAVPDTQDILGRYELTLTGAGDVIGYELRERYQRSDVKEEL